MKLLFHPTGVYDWKGPVFELKLRDDRERESLKATCLEHRLNAVWRSLHEDPIIVTPFCSGGLKILCEVLEDEDGLDVVRAGMPVWAEDIRSIQLAATDSLKGS